jgi:hypothetical protein
VDFLQHHLHLLHHLSIHQELTWLWEEDLVNQKQEEEWVVLLNHQMQEDLVVEWEEDLVVVEWVEDLVNLVWEINGKKINV